MPSETTLRGRPEPTVVRGYDRLAPVYDALAALYSGRRIGACHRIVADRVVEGERVLCVGVGTGRDSAAAARRGAYPTLVDCSPAMLDRAATRVRHAGTEPVSLLGDVREVPLDGPYDAVVASFFLNVFRTDELGPLVARLRETLRPGGRLLVADFAPPRGGRLGRALQRAYHDLPMHFFGRCTGNARHSIHDVAGALTAGGLQVVARTPVRVFGIGPAWLEVVEAVRR